MTIVELKSQIMKKTMSNFYIFVGNEIGIMNIYLEQMSNELNMPIVRADSVLSIYDICTTRSIFGNENSIYAIRNDTDIMKHEEMYTRMEGEVKYGIIILLYDKIDSRLKFGKYFKDRIVEFEPLTTSILSKYIKKECALSDRNLEKLSNIVSNSYDLAMLEADKINQYSNATGREVNSAFEELLKQKAIYQPEEYDVFKFSELVMNKDKVHAFKMLNILLENGSSSVSILGVLYLKVKCVLLIQVCENSDIVGTTGLSKGEVYYNKVYVNKYTSEKLVKSLKLIARVVDDIKSGKIDDTYATHYVLVNMF